MKLCQTRGAARAAPWRPAGRFPVLPPRAGPGPGSSELPAVPGRPLGRCCSAFARSLERRCCVVTFSDDELSLLVIVIDTNPIWWGKKALGEAEVRLLGVGTIDGGF